MPIHIAITRRMLPGREQEFKAALRRFLGESFIHGGVHGAGMITSIPGGHERDIGILRTFNDDAERDAFYNSDLFKNWEEYASTVTEGVADYRQLNGLEAWFRTPGAPPRWKMAIATFAGVYPTSILLAYTIGEYLHSFPVIIKSLITAAAMVALLTWIVMPNVTKFLKNWLHAK
ncbi:MAG: antibiotic biosynthesis monooxygenase [Micavibrio aeruginosavorus]|uniref:Antibiotic biosynthesis monooxygenase n=1 Tax=Micavibrio aeruginosavorus TaxID=349221 RepID=A0A2W5FMN2_9BACT|nr:MAG: antibiotic biosynthesis monooxygenase [Micavibrio aeruginosavorus]